MSDYDVSPSEMRRLGDISDSDLDAMRDGHLPHGDQSLEGIARFVQDLGAAFPERSTADLEDTHVAAMMQVAHLMADNSEPAAKPASKANGPENQASGLPKPWREATMSKLKTMFATRVAKVTAAAVAMLLAFSGIAVAGVLPDPIQNTVADAAHSVGIELPGGTDEVDVNEDDQDDVNVDEEALDQADENDEGDALESDQVDQDEDQQDADEADQQDAEDQDADEADQQDAEDQDADEADQQDSSAADSADHGDGDTPDQDDAGDGGDLDGND